MQKNYIQPLYLTAYTKINSTRMEVEIIIINELCQTEKDIVMYHLCMESKKNKWSYLQNINKLKDIENKLMATEEEGREGQIKSLG